MNETTTIATAYSLVGARRVLDELAVAGGYHAYRMGLLSVVYRMGSPEGFMFLEICLAEPRKYSVVKRIESIPSVAY